MSVYTKKRLIEKNKLGTKNDFERMKTQVLAKGKSFRQKHLKSFARSNSKTQMKKLGS
jgi:hypothetical protein